MQHLHSMVPVMKRAVVTNSIPGRSRYWTSQSAHWVSWQWTSVKAHCAFCNTRALNPSQTPFCVPNSDQSLKWGPINWLGSEHYRIKSSKRPCFLVQYTLVTAVCDLFITSDGSECWCNSAMSITTHPSELQWVQAQSSQRLRSSWVLQALRCISSIMVFQHVGSRLRESFDIGNGVLIEMH